MTRPFTFPGLTTRVVFGHGTLAQVPDEVARLGHSRALVLSTPHQQAEAQALADTPRRQGRRRLRRGDHAHAQSR